MSARLRDESGFTLIELLVTMVLLVVVFGAVLTNVDAFQRQNAATERQGDAQDAVRQAADRMAASLRGAVSTSASTALERATPYDVVFQTVDGLNTPAAASTNPKGLMRVRFCLDTTGAATNQKLYMDTQRWPTLPAPPAIPSDTSCPGTGWDATSIVTGGLANPVNPTPAGAAGQLFTFRPIGATGSDISGVDLDLFVYAGPNRRAATSELRTGVSLRNLNRAPIAQATCNAVGNGGVACDASDSSDPDGQFLAYAWTQTPGAACADNPVAGATTSSLSVGGLTGTYSFGLTVTDPAGLTATACRTVVVS